MAQVKPAKEFKNGITQLEFHTDKDLVPWKSVDFSPGPVLGIYGEQTFSRLWQLQFFCYLDAPGVQEPNISIVAVGSCNASAFKAPQQHIISEEEYLRGWGTAMLEFQVSPTDASGSPLQADMLERFSLQRTSPETVNHTISQSDTTSTSIGMSWNVNGQVGAMQGEPMGSVGGGFTHSTEKGFSHTDTIQISEWAIENISSPAQDSNVARWVYHQEFPFDVYKLQPSKFGTWWEQAFEKKHNRLKDWPDLTTELLTPKFSAGWTIPARYVKGLPNQTLHFSLSDTLTVMAFSNLIGFAQIEQLFHNDKLLAKMDPRLQAWLKDPNNTKDPKESHRRAQFKESSDRWVQALDLSSMFKDKAES